MILLVGRNRQGCDLHIRFKADDPVSHTFNHFSSHNGANLWHIADVMIFPSFKLIMVRRKEG